MAERKNSGLGEGDEKAVLHAVMARKVIGEAQRGVDAAVEGAVDVGEEPVDGAHGERPRIGGVGVGDATAHVVVRMALLRERGGLIGFRSLAIGGEVATGSTLTIGDEFAGTVPMLVAGNDSAGEK